jgi:acyl-CoA thioester hydrolase
MDNFIKNIEVRWSDLDPNFHVLHSKYYDFGAYCRMAFLVENGLSPAIMLEHKIGPILFREECVFKREIFFGDKVTVNVKVDKVTADFGRWTMIHEIYKNDETLAAIITADGAWLNTSIRKLTVPPAVVISLFEISPKTASFKIS